MRSGLMLFSVGCIGGTEVKVEAYNVPPSAIMVQPVDGAQFNEGEVVQFEARVDDNYDSPSSLSTLWMSDVQGELLGGGQPTEEGVLLYSTANLEAGNHVISLTVLDSEGASTQASVQVEIVDLPEQPLISVLLPEMNTEGSEDDLVTFSAEVSDARDLPQVLIVSVESDVDGSICTIQPSESGVASCQELLNVGQHLVTFTVTNTAGYTASATTYYRVKSLLEIDNDEDGFTENQGDCDDLNDSIHPGGTEVENGLDDDCDELTDEGTNAYDDDGDGFSENQGDCDDTDVLIHPDAVEICHDNIDNNCNSVQNEQNAVDCTDYFLDSDGDGYGSSLTSECWCDAYGNFSVENDDDCYDANAQARPNQLSYFSVDRGDGSFDYDCDSTEEQEFTIAGSCNPWGSSLGDCTINTIGWDGAIPECGETGATLQDNDSCSAGCFVGQFPLCCEAGGPSYATNQVQSCR